jgi:hypothetical protein
MPSTLPVSAPTGVQWEPCTSDILFAFPHFRFGYGRFGYGILDRPFHAVPEKSRQNDRIATARVDFPALSGAFVSGAVFRSLF